MSNSKHLNLDNARTPEQKALMEKIIADGVCPFCAEHFKTYHPKPILKETAHWFLSENMSPYKGTKHHFIYVYKPSHISHISEASPEAMTDLFSLITWTADTYKITGGAFFVRFGDTRYNGSSVTHLHAHLIMGDAEEPNHEPVRVKLG